MRLFCFAIFALFIQTISLTESYAKSVQEVAVLDQNNQVQIILDSSESNMDQLALSCTCYRGPGTGQPYSCEPIAKTCYGGPGNYPYTCFVCPR